MAFSSVVRTLSRTALTQELTSSLERDGRLQLDGVPRFPKGLMVSALAHQRQQHLCLIAATLEEAGRWAAQLQEMDWPLVHFYPTSEASPYEASDSDEITWGQLQVLADLVHPTARTSSRFAIVATQRALHPHLPPREQFAQSCLCLKLGLELSLGQLKHQLTELGYESVSLVEAEGQWSRRGDIIDIFPVAAELPLRLEFFGDELEKMREFDPISQRSLDKVQQVVLTPCQLNQGLGDSLGEEESDLSPSAQVGLAFDAPSSLLDYLPPETLFVLDEPEACQGHSDRWVEHVEQDFQSHRDRHPHLSPLHRPIQESLGACTLDRVELRELVLSDRDADNQPGKRLNLASRRLASTPHQFAKIAQILRQERDRGFNIFLISAQPSRTVSLLQEHDCNAQFLPNPRDYPAVDRLQTHHVPIALKYAGQAELEGFVLPTLRLVVVSDREFFGQHSLASPSYVRKRRRAASKQVDPNQLQPGDYVVHHNHGIGQFLQLESLTLNGETREYLVLRYADGTLRVAADQLNALSRYRHTGSGHPQLNKMSGKAWERTKNKVRKAIKKIAIDLLKLYAERAKQQGFAYPADIPWQQELEDSFPYQPTPDQLKATQDIKHDMESDRPMDRLVCGDVGFGKTEVAIRAVFKAITAGKQVAFLAPTTILTQQHYHTLKERFAPYPIQVGLLNRFRSPEERKEIQQRLMTGELDVVVGTHQLLGKSVKFKDLGLLVVDEEQRFGVNQKEKIKALKTQVDVLTLTATPIPRTLYMSLSGIREISLITTPPPSRRPIKTHLARYDWETIRGAIAQELDRGGQVFYVVPRVEGIEERSTKIREVVPSARIAIAHGQMDVSELESVMLAFSSGEADVLVCTTIVESGLDIPRVNTILIEDAHRFGLSQLYQLRGRVGRSGIQAHAWLFYSQRQQLSEAAQKRLRALQEFSQLGSGYQLAMRDMEIRGVGNLLGAEQSGQMNAIGFDLYRTMLEEEIREIQGQAIPKVNDTQVDLNLTAFIPSNYIPDLDHKMTAYRQVATADSGEALQAIALDWQDCYGPLPKAASQLLRVMELKQLAKTLGFSRIKPEGKQHVVLETPMEEPAWGRLKSHLPKHLQSRFVYGTGRVTVRGLGVLPAEKQLDSLIQWLECLRPALEETQETDNLAASAS
ncbi:transcription-repair coupling factor [Sodalinema gerasimenkoae]|uniref:transcription-repair coupling factor n=1 Tax=Sodalinema gerasimenkoae TaxID=2862348 RepID=UPI00135AF141|nr:transcription-repair coupling factor [Sodalinema gerasimenkoae]